MVWKKQGAGWVGRVQLTDGRPANVVLVGSRQDPKGSVILLAQEGGQVQPVVLRDVLNLLDLPTVIEVLCVQERAFGAYGLPMPKESAEQS